MVTAILLIVSIGLLLFSSAVSHGSGMSIEEKNLGDGVTVTSVIFFFLMNLMGAACAVVAWRVNQ